MKGFKWCLEKGRWVFPPADHLRKALGGGTAGGVQKCSNLPVPSGSGEGRVWQEMRVETAAFKGPCLAC